MMRTFGGSLKGTDTRALAYYDPAKAQSTDFTPFRGFVTGPIHAGGVGP